MRIKNYIAGNWVESRGKDFLEVKNPATEEVLAEVPEGDLEDFQMAVTSAQEAFRDWKNTPVIERVQPLFRLKGLLEDSFEDLARTLTKEHGKTLDESRGSVRRAIQMVETATGMPSLMMGESSEDVARGIDSFSIKRPLGVYAGITPFNFPVMVGFWFWPFAVASGNTYIMKPSPRVPLTMAAAFELIEKVGFPSGVVNLLNGGKEMVNAICTHSDVKGISFVGSTPVARHVYSLGTQNGKRVQALGGAKNFLVVMPDAPMDLAIKTCLESVIGCSGQRCLAGSVVIGVGEAYDDLQKKVLSSAKAITVGDGLNPETKMGPVISKESKNRISALIDRAVKEGATLLLDGRKSYESQKGFFLGPTVLADVKPEMEIAQVEVFGPVVCLGRASDLKKAIDWINSSPFANTTSLFTTSGRAAREFRHEVDPSMIGINIGVPAPMSYFSFGGSKDSFFGDIKAHGRQCVDFFTDAKVSIERWGGEASIWQHR